MFKKEEEESKEVWIVTGITASGELVKDRIKK
jgi:hypothetical protein